MNQPSEQSSQNIDKNHSFVSYADMLKKPKEVIRNSCSKRS